MKNRLLAVICILLSVTVIGPAYGKGKKKKATPAPAYHAPVISSVSGNAITVSDEKTTRTFTVTQFTEINVNGQKANIGDLKPGMTAKVTIATDPSRASRINAEGVPAEGDRKKK
jgi:hypothetical protein